MALKDGPVGSNNIRSGSVAGGALAIVLSDTKLGSSNNPLGSYINVMPGATLEVGGTNSNPGILNIEATTKADAVDSVRLETASGYSATHAHSEIRSNTDANVVLDGSTIINRSGDVKIATQSDVNLRPSSNLFSAAANAYAGADAVADADVDNTITVDGATIRGGEVRIQSGRSNFQVPNLLSTFADIEVTTVSLGPSIAIGVPTSSIDFLNQIDVIGNSKIEAFKDATLIAEQSKDIPARADTDGLVLSLSGIPYGYPVSSTGEHADGTAGVNVANTASITAGVYNQSVLFIGSALIDNIDPARLALTDESLAGGSSDPGMFTTSDYQFADSKDLTLDTTIPYHFAPLKIDEIALDISIGTIVQAKPGAYFDGEDNVYYRYYPLDARGRLRTDVTATSLVLQNQDYTDTRNWQRIGLSLPGGFDQDNAPPVYTSDFTKSFEQSLSGKFYLIKNPNLPSPTLSYRNVGNLLVQQRNQVMSWIKSHANNPEAVARYEVQLQQINDTLNDLGLIEQTVLNGQTQTVVREELDALFIDLPGVYAAPGSIFVEGKAEQVHLSGEVKARDGSSIVIHNATPFVPIVNDAIIKDNRRVAVVDDELRQFTPGNVYINWTAQAPVHGGDGFGNASISITHQPDNRDFGLTGIPETVLKDMYLNGDVVNENGTVSIANPVGSINVTGEVRGATVMINAGRDFNLNTEDWLHTNRDPRQYLNFHPLRQMVYNDAGNTVRQLFPDAHSISIPTYKTIRFWGFTFTVPDYSSPPIDLQEEIDKDQSQILAQGAINVTAQFLNVNGLIQSGSQTLKLDIAPTFRMNRTTTSLTDTKNRPLPGISFGTANDGIAGRACQRLFRCSSTSDCDQRHQRRGWSSHIGRQAVVHRPWSDRSGLRQR